MVFSHFSQFSAVAPGDTDGIVTEQGRVAFIGVYGLKLKPGSGTSLHQIPVLLLALDLGRAEVRQKPHFTWMLDVGCSMFHVRCY